MDKATSFNWIKATLVCINVFLTATVAAALKIQYGFFSVTTAYVLIQVYLDKVYLKTIERMLGPCVAFILTLLVITILHNHFIIMLVSAALLTFLFIYYYSKDHFSYAMLLGGITVSFMSALAYTSSTAAAVKIGVYWVINIFLASVIVLVITYLARKWLPEKSNSDQLTPSQTWQVHFKNHFQTWKDKSSFNFISFLIATRVTLTVMILTLINQAMGWSSIDLQAVIAGTVVSAQLSIEKTHLYASLRILGVITGAIIAIIYAHILQVFPNQILLVLLITFTLGAFSLFGERFAKTQYAFIQAGMMLPIILLTSSATIINTTLAWQRALGSLEGGVIGIMMVYISLSVQNYKTNLDKKI